MNSDGAVASVGIANYFWIFMEKECYVSVDTVKIQWLPKMNIKNSLRPCQSQADLLRPVSYRWAELYLLRSSCLRFQSGLERST